MDYTLNPEAAKQADNFYYRIEEKGKYLGVITRAEAVTSKKGTKGIDLSFKSDTGATADYLTLWTHNVDGKQLMGYNALMAIMTCLRVKNLKAENGEIDKFDFDLNKRAKVVVPLFKDLMSKPIGLLLAMEEYPKNAGGTGWKPVISAPFDKDGFTASEILNKAKSPEVLDKMLAALKDRPLKGAATSSATSKDESEHPGASLNNPFADFDDNIPF